MTNTALIAVAVLCFGYFAATHLRPQWVAMHKAWWRELAGAIGALALLVPLIEDFLSRQQSSTGADSINLPAAAILALIIGGAVNLLGVSRAVGEPKAIAISVAMCGIAYLVLMGH